MKQSSSTVTIIRIGFKSRQTYVKKGLFPRNTKILTPLHILLPIFFKSLAFNSAYLQRLCLVARDVDPNPFLRICFSFGSSHSEAAMNTKLLEHF